MRVYINEITGLGDACASLLMSKRTWTRTKEVLIRQACKANITENGALRYDCTQEMMNKIDTLIKYGILHGHTTLLRYIDISVTVEGLHRAAQDDFDSHAKRLDNRIVRSSTRLATFGEGEKSDWYKDKILYPFEVMEILDMNIPKFIEHNDATYIKTDFGYIRADLLHDKDVKRGLYPLAIPSNFIFKVQYPELCHIVQHRDNNSQANPELKQMIEMLRDELTQVFPALGLNLNVLKMQP